MPSDDFPQDPQDPQDRPLEAPPQDAAVAFANFLIDLANTHMEEGASAQDLAAGLRHAAANFSAFAFFRTFETAPDPNGVVGEFASFFEYYLDRHKPAASPAQGLFNLIEQAKG
ncbi:hypothetical protein [Varunaivibrio sulfuroxidans]|uniref:Uncharacterized protein n=1 Tax=Varunaivibrio sulfuroxidans TaxID=1773489 RepID=A0A4R3J400_9PROT|nr:hypothetical protein [Varunaivibrio sulfuroxidans]TCS60528.1 hypothetical protein EDD55_1102 [Varunaivibrio sulfuroxidans]WES30019.1 hypothetical protein P3M64_10275 [Varunaivibrio sulfuroxidans]